MPIHLPIEVVQENKYENLSLIYFIDEARKVDECERPGRPYHLEVGEGDNVVL